MDIDDITPTLVNDTLRAWRGAEETPAGLLGLDILREKAATTLIERSIHLRERVEKTTGSTTITMQVSSVSRVTLLGRLGMARISRCCRG